MLLSALVVGAKGAIGSTYNVAAKVYLQVIDAYNKGDIETARVLQDRSWQLVKAIRRYAPPHTSMKAILGMLGLNVGPIRLPQQQLPEGAAEKIRNHLNEIGFFDWIR